MWYSLSIINGKKQVLHLLILTLWLITYFFENCNIGRRSIMVNPLLSTSTFEEPSFFTSSTRCLCEEKCLKRTSHPNFRHSIYMYCMFFSLYVIYICDVCRWSQSREQVYAVLWKQELISPHPPIPPPRIVFNSYLYIHEYGNKHIGSVCCNYVVRVSIWTVHSTIKKLVSLLISNTE